MHRYLSVASAIAKSRCALNHLPLKKSYKKKNPKRHGCLGGQVNE
jgi:hypothetical protein